VEPHRGGSFEASRSVTVNSGVVEQRIVNTNYGSGTFNNIGRDLKVYGNYIHVAQGQ
jgi:hypothetical protein